MAYRRFGAESSGGYYVYESFNKNKNMWQRMWLAKLTFREKVC